MKNKYEIMLTLNRRLTKAQFQAEYQIIRLRIGVTNS